jgi:archaeosine synthase
MLACSSESQNRVEVRRFAARVNERVICEGDILLVIPCSARKPYSNSQSHMAILNAIKKYRSYVREAILTSPLGVVPRELELVYPAAHYDVAVTGYWDLEERKWVSDCLKDFIMKNKFKKIIAHVEGPYVDVCKDTGIEMEFTSMGRVTDDASLQRLNDALDSAAMALNPDRRGYERSRLDMFRMMADYQFGKGKGSLLVPERGVIKGKPPRLALFDGQEQLCQIIPEFGSLTMTIEGARRMLTDGAYTVDIADFTPKGSILAPGVLNADHTIRPGDDVFVKGSKAVAVGKAKMGGREMVDAKRGIAVELRHVEKLS